eukprot:2623257-Pleurochrysis_carterae.AAC.1
MQPSQNTAMLASGGASSSLGSGASSRQNTFRAGNISPSYHRSRPPIPLLAAGLGSSVARILCMVCRRSVSATFRPRKG